MLDLGLSLPAGGQCIGSANMVMFHHHGWEPDGGTWRESVGRCPPPARLLFEGLQVSAIKFMCTAGSQATCLAGLCSPPLGVVCLLCRYFK